MCMEKNNWEKAVEFHGHTCPGLTIGYRVAEIALHELETIRSADEELVAIVENDACGVDAIQVLTGCSLGKGNLIFRDYGKQVYTFACRDSGKAVRVAVKGTIWPKDPGYLELRKKIFGGTATEEEKATFLGFQQDLSRRMMEMPAVEFCEVRHINMELPGKARIFDSHTCARCGEPVMEPRARVKAGRIVCIPCSEQYDRGW